MEEVAAIQKESKEKSKTYSSSLPCKVPSNFQNQMELVNVIINPLSWIIVASSGENENIRNLC